jgi:predicted GNAT family N-acyltransferase
MTETKLELQYADNGDDTVTDLKHNLMWMKKDTWVTLGRLITWHESQELARKMNEEKFAGYGNWRIPSASEVKHLFHLSASNTDVEGCEIHVDPVFTSGCGFSTWTSQTRGAKAAMAYDLRSDFEFWLAKENDGFPSAVRLVRDNVQEEEDPDFVRIVLHKDGTVTDHKTSLMWKAEDSYVDLDKWVSWDEAKNYVQQLNRARFAGYRNWRMPTRKEAQAIYDASNPVTDNYGDTVFLAKGFPPGCGLTCWTKTLNKSDKGLAVRFHFYNGDYKWHGMGLRSHGVRAVRNIESDS